MQRLGWRLYSCIMINSADFAQQKLVTKYYLSVCIVLSLLVTATYCSDFTRFESVSIVEG